mgnify:CR=1 FL=1
MTNACAYIGVGKSLIYFGRSFLQPQTRISGPRFFVSVWLVWGVPVFPISVRAPYTSI